MDESCLKPCLRTDDGYALESVRGYCWSVLNLIDGIQIITANKPKEKKRCLTTLYEQIVSGLGHLPDGVVYSIENDVLYHPSRFEFNPPANDTFYYQTNFFELTRSGFIRHGTGLCNSQLVANNSLWRENLKARIKAMKNGWKLVWSEPGRGDPPEIKSKIATYYSKYPDVGVRHGRNYTGDRKADLYIDRIPYWGDYRELLDKLGINETKQAKLNVGSGCMLMPGYVNFDTVKVVRGDKHTDVVGDARDLLDHFESGSFNEIMCCHILEHLRPLDGKKLLLDCYKLLRPGGVVVVECPDVLKMIAMWNEKNPTFGDPPNVQKLINFLYGWRKDQWRDYGYHQYGYTVDSAAELVSSCGYQIVKKCEGRMHGRRARDFRIEGKK